MNSPELNSNLAYSCFTFGNVNFVPTVEEYTILLRYLMIQVEKAYSRAANVLTFLKRLMNITGMSEQWVATWIKQKGNSKCVLWKSLWDLILVHPDTRKRVIFPKTLGHVDDAVLDLFDRLEKRVMLVPIILAKTFSSLGACRRVGEGRFIKCVQLLLAWFHSHFWKVEKVSYQVFSEDYSLLKEFVAIPRRDNIFEKSGWQLSRGSKTKSGM
ncbi:hypothetical protein Golob_025407 [Gossypium lobatum]|uniref:Uncharacterized protein n=2 Tax=Gossypium lobatum TaxID=34289 RepID=A0A7J8NFF5_9ROSI|nr:hypothetical protein [Gossypium lobatum]